MSFSGPPGSGKTVLAVEAANLLRLRGWKVRVLRSYPLSFYSMGGRHAPKPGGEDHDHEPEREGGFTRFLLRLFARWMFLANLVLAWLSIRAQQGSGYALVFDRYIYDTIVELRYEGVCGDGFMKRLAKLIPKPDVSFLLRVAPEIAKRRKPECGAAELSEKAEIYLDIKDSAQWVVVDTESEKRAREEVRGILAYVERDW